MRALKGLEAALEMDAPICPVCSGSESMVWGMRTAHIIYECKACGVVYFDRKQLNLHDYQAYYEYTDTWDEARVAWELKIRRRSFTKQLAQIGKYVQGRTLVDVGAGPGYLCRIAADNGWQASGIEVSVKARNVGARFLAVNYVDVDQIAEESVDAITCHHVLEHMERPDEFIAGLRSKLKPGGVMAIHVPHREPLCSVIQNRLRALRSPSAEKQCALYAPEHISGFTKKSLVNTFARFGFQPLMVRTSAPGSTYYDPFFLKNYLRERNYIGIVKSCLRGGINNVGVPLGLGDWVVAHFRKG